MILWRDVAETLMFLIQTLNIKFFSLWYFPKHWCFIAASSMIVDDSLERYIGNSDSFDETFLISFVRNVLTSEALFFDCWFIDDSLIIPWRNIDVRAKVSMQASMIFKCFIDLISETLMFHCCFVVDCWWFFGETYLKQWWFRSQLFWSSLFLLC